jgi:hypothetical protein
LNLWVQGLQKEKSLLLLEPMTVLGERKKPRGPHSEFAMVQVTLSPASSLEVVDRIAEKEELERLGVGWPEAVVFGLLDVLMFFEPGPLYKIAVVLEKAWYHDADSSFMAFRHAGRDAGRKAVEELMQFRRWKFDL